MTGMQFQVPQFIEVEDKIFGPLTFRQFVFVAGGAGMCYLLWRTLPLIASAPLIIAVAGLAAALAFMQYNGRPFIVAMENAFYFLLHPKLYLWNNEQRSRVTPEKQEARATASDGEVYIPHLSDSRLHELAWSLDIKERIAGGIAPDDERGIGSVQPMRTARDAIASFGPSNS